MRTSILIATFNITIAVMNIANSLTPAHTTASHLINLLTIAVLLTGGWLLFKHVTHHTRRVIARAATPIAKASKPAVHKQAAARMPARKAA